jgi:hypothetical protein
MASKKDKTNLVNPYHRCSFIDTSVQYYNYWIDRKYVGAICSRIHASLLTKDQIRVLLY